MLFEFLQQKVRQASVWNFEAKMFHKFLIDVW